MRTINAMLWCRLQAQQGVSFASAKRLFRACGFCLALSLWLGAAFAQYSGDTASLWAQASVYRDEWGVPHVYGDSPRAMAFAFGYAQAEDHLEAMLMAYRVAGGRAAEVLGEALAPSDEFALKMAHADQAQRALASLDPLTIDLCEGFAVGANAWIVEHPDRVPVWCDGVRPHDPLALLHCYLMSFAPFDLPNVWRRDPPSLSGNAWAIAPSKTESGETLLAINPHTHYDSPFRWYEAHLNCPGINMAGATLFGLPVILQGHNEVLGWALTPNQPDFADVYVESFGMQKRDPRILNLPPLPDEERLLQELMIATARPYYVHTPHGADMRSVSCMTGPHGPIVGSDKGHPCGYLVGGYEDFGAIAQLMEMAHAQNLDAFLAALAMHQLPCFHIVYADREGNIFYRYNAKMGDKPVADGPPPEPPAPPKEPEPGMPNLAPPDRPPASKQREPALIDWTAPLDGANPLFRWQGIIPPDALPSLANPPSGYLQACGTPPWAVTDGTGLDPARLPGWFSRDRDSLRAQRVRRLLAMGKRSFRDCQAMLYDVVVPGAGGAVQRLIQLADQRADFVNDAHPDLAAGIDLLRSWNGLSDTASTGMTFYHAWWTSLRRHVQPMNGMGMSAPWQADDALMIAFQENSEPFQDAIMSAALDAARMMRNEFDSVSVPWGSVHTLTRGAREAGLAGATSGEPIMVASDTAFDAKKWRVTYGYGFAMAVSFGEKTSAVSMVPFGSSEDPKSPHFADQLDLMAERRFKVTRFALEDVQRHATSARGRSLCLRPKGTGGQIILTSEAPVEARLNALSEPPAPPPEGLVPFTVYMEIEKAPKAAPVHIRLEIPVSAVLCARENLPSLAVHACDTRRDWVRLPAQTLDAESRTFTADDEQGPAVYAILGPAEFRASRLVIPGETSGASPGEPFRSETGAAMNQQNQSDNASVPAETDMPSTESSAPMRGVPPKQSRAPIVIPQELQQPKADTPPTLEFVPPQNEQSKPKDRSAPAPKRNYRFDRSKSKQ